MIKKIKLVSLLSALSPAFSFAQTGQAGFTTIGGSIDSVINIIAQLIPLIISIGLVLFLFGVIKFVTAGGDEEKRASARGMIIFGIIALFVMTAVWGLVNILKGSIFGADSNPILETPNYPIAPGSTVQ